MHRRQVVFLSFALLLALLLGGWLLMGYLDGRQNKPEARASQGASWQAELVRRVRSLNDQAPQVWPFSAMRGSAEFMPQQIRRAAKATLGKGEWRLGLRFDDAQYVDTALGIGIWVVRGKGVICIFHERRAVAGCTTDADAARRGLIMVMGQKEPGASRTLPTRFLALGIAPDWARAVQLQIVGGALKTDSVIDNTYALRARAPINLERLISASTTATPVFK